MLLIGKKKRNLLDVQIISVLVSLADGDGYVEFDDCLDKLRKVLSMDGLVSRLERLNALKVLSFEILGFDNGVYTNCRINDKTKFYLVDCVAQLSGSEGLLNERVQEILAFDRDGLRRRIKSSTNEIKSIKKAISKRREFESLSKDVSEIEGYFSSLDRVAEDYDDVYKNIIKPVQDESRRSIRLTVLVAVLGIVSSVALPELLRSIGIVV